jgi:Fic family protein
MQGLFGLLLLRSLVSQFRLRAAQSQTNERQRQVLERLLEAGHARSGGGFLGGMTNEKYAKITGTSKATATRDLAALPANGLLRVEGAGKATRYAVNVPGWEQPAPKP